MTTLQAMTKARWESMHQSGWETLSPEMRSIELTAMRAALAAAITNAPRLHDLADTYHRAITAILAEETI